MQYFQVKISILVLLVSLVVRLFERFINFIWSLTNLFCEKRLPHFLVIRSLHYLSISSDQTNPRFLDIFFLMADDLDKFFSSKDKKSKIFFKYFLQNNIYYNHSRFTGSKGRSHTKKKGVRPDDFLAKFDSDDSKEQQNTRVEPVPVPKLMQRTQVDDFIFTFEFQFYKYSS